MSVSVYAVALDSISMTLKTRDSKHVNMGITIANCINGITWATYAILIRDIYVLIPNIAALISVSIQLNLYKWTTGEVEHNHWLIKFLQRKFNVRGVKTLKVQKLSSSSIECHEDDEELSYLNKKRDTLKRDKTKQMVYNKGHNEKEKDVGSDDGDNPYKI